MPNLKVGVGGVWKDDAAKAWVGVGGAWKLIESIKAGVGGAWKDGYIAIRLDAATYNQQDSSPADVESWVHVNSPSDVSNPCEVTTGVSSGSDITQYLWAPLGTSASAYEVKADLLSGTLFSGTAGTWQALTSNRSWAVQRTSNIVGTDTVSLSVSIRRASDAVVVAGPVTIVLEAQVTA